MLAFFRTNQLLFGIFLILYAALLHASVFFVADDWVPGASGLWSEWIFSSFGHKGLQPDIAAIVLLGLQGMGLNALNMTHRLNEPVNLFPGLFYVLFASLFPEFLHLSPVLLANTFYILALYDLMSIYNRTRSAGYIFNAGLWIALAGFFYFSFLLFILLAFIALNILRAFDIRERLMVLCGLLTPYLLAGAYFYWFGQWDFFVEHQFVRNFTFFHLPEGPLSGIAISKLALFGFLLATALYNRGEYLLKQNIQVQKKINLLYWGLLFGGLSLFIQHNLQLDHLLILSVPLGILLSFNFTKLPKNWAELFHALLLIAALFYQFSPLLQGG